MALSLLAATAVVLLLIAVSGSGSGAAEYTEQGIVINGTYIQPSVFSFTRPPETMAPTPTDTFNYLVLVNWDAPTGSARPKGLVTLGAAFGQEVLLANAEGSVNAEAAKAASAMFLAAADEDLDSYLITSAYRSVDYQNQIWLSYSENDLSYGSDPYNSPVKAMPGNMSEHATGLALDILSESYSVADDAYADTPEGRWLAENCWRFGFILRYPAGKEHITGVIFEPWHYRFVGVEAALEMCELDLCLEEYIEYLYG